MKKIISAFLILLLFCTSQAQNENLDKLKEVKGELPKIIPVALLDNNKFKTLANLILNDPQLYNEVWNRVYNGLREKKDLAALKNLKIEFKTFQVPDSSRASLGFSYAWDYEIRRNKESDYEQSSFIGKINVAGNIAFRKRDNPNDFQEAKLAIGRYGFAGGTVKKLDTATIRRLNNIRLKLANIEDKEELKSSPLWEELTSAMGIKNHYHYSITANGGWEGSQDFSKSQLAYGLQLRFSAKAYSNKNALAQLNLLDYPFALIRFLTGTDKALTPYGAALPLVTIGIDQVKPTRDTARKRIINNINSFTRFRFEAGFRTLIADVASMPVHFNAAFRYFKEFGPSSAIRAAKLDAFSYFTCSITGNNTYFASYSYGKLPFDRTNNAVYAVGFKLNL